jgi:hypothetical protein
MTNNSTYKDYISLMVQETFEGINHKDSVQLDSKVNNVLEFKKSQQLEFNFDSIQGVYDSNRQCYIFSISEYELEFPANWQLFTASPQQMIDGDTLFAITEDDDPCGLLSILGTVLGQVITFAECKWLKSQPVIVVNQVNLQSHAA